MSGLVWHGFLNDRCLYDDTNPLLIDIKQEYLELTDPVPDILTFQGVCHFHLEDVDSSIRCYEQALELDGSYIDALKGLGQCYIKSDAGEISSEVCCLILRWRLYFNLL